MIPKFRAWDKKTETIQEVESISFKEKKLVIDQKSVAWFNSDYIRNFDEVELMQSTGLKDKNGVEIFEGDIVLITHKSTNYADTYWHSYAEVFRAKNGAYRIRGEHIYETELYGNRKQLTVAGNIYNSPELLKRDRFMTTTENPELLEDSNEHTRRD
ncbi:hypothetical protein UL360_001818 [Enterococcus faecium]|nr:hypothetical protein [Enterococcus faecium]EME3503465.1 hypothetical protein [Enterococcus faecium]EME7138598.1 hypothetical protein [Enterococcus faecium]EME8273792.1 hypothetical protein [Enterococcus faecium]